MSVIFIRPYGNYVTGSSATLSADTEASLIQQGIAKASSTSQIGQNLPFQGIENGISPENDQWAAARGITIPAKILRSAQRGIAPIDAVMAVPPTISAGAIGVASTLNGAAATNVGVSNKFNANPRKYELISGYVASDLAAADRTVSYIDAGSRRPGHGNCARFMTDAPAFDMLVGGGATGRQFIVYVTDMTVGASSRARVSANDLTVAFASAYYHLFTFVDARPRMIEVYRGYTIDLIAVPIFGFNVANAYSIWQAPEADQPRIAMISDSWGDLGGAANTNPTKLLYPDYIGEVLGCNNPLVLCQAGSGWVNRATNKGTYTERMLNGDLDIARIGAVDLVVVWDTLNDRLFDSVIIDAKINGLQLIRQKQPGALIINWGPQVTPNTATPQSAFDLGSEAFNRALGTDANAIYIDNSPNGENWLNTSNAATYFTAGTDGNHLNNQGNSFLGRRSGRSIVAAIQRKFSS